MSIKKLISVERGVYGIWILTYGDEDGSNEMRREDLLRYFYE